MNKKPKFLISYLKLVILLSGFFFCGDLLAAKYDRFVLHVGRFFPALDTKVRLDPSTPGQGDPVDLEGNLNLDEDLNISRFDAYYNFNRQHRVYLAHYKFNRDNASSTLNEDIQIGDTLFPAGLGVISNSDTTLTELGYAYTFYRKRDFEVAATAGLHILETDIDIRSTDGALFEETNISAPLPLLGLDIRYLLARDWSFYVTTMVFAVEIGNVDGSLTDTRIGTEYYFTDHFGVGMGYHQFDLDIEYDDAGDAGRFRWSYGGFQAFVSMRF